MFLLWLVISPLSKRCYFLLCLLYLLQFHLWALQYFKHYVSLHFIYASNYYTNTSTHNLHSIELNTENYLIWKINYHQYWKLLEMNPTFVMKRLLMIINWMTPTSTTKGMIVLLRVELQGHLSKESYILLEDYQLLNKRGLLKKPLHKKLRIENNVLLQNYILIGKTIYIFQIISNIRSNVMNLLLFRNMC